MKIIKHFKIFFLLILITLPNLNSKKFKKSVRRTLQEQDNAARDMVAQIKQKFGNLLEVLNRSKIFNFIMGALTRILRSSGNPLLDSVFCIVDSIKLYKKLKAERKSREELLEQEIENQPDQIAEQEEAQNDQIEQNEESQPNIPDEQIINESSAELSSIEENPNEDFIDNSVSLQDDQFKQLEESLETESLPNEVEKKKKSIMKKFKNGLKSLKGKMRLGIKKIGEGMKKGFLKVRNFFKNLFEKLKNFIDKLTESPLFQALKEFSICIIPQILTVAIDSMSIFTSIFNGSLVINIIKQSPSLFKTIVKSIRGIWNVKGNQKLSIQQKFESYGENTGDIITAFIKAFVGKAPAPAKPCPK